MKASFNGHFLWISWALVTDLRLPSPQFAGGQSLQVGVMGLKQEPCNGTALCFPSAAPSFSPRGASQLTYQSE